MVCGQNFKTLDPIVYFYDRVYIEYLLLIMDIWSFVKTAVSVFVIILVHFKKYWESETSRHVYFGFTNSMYGFVLTLYIKLIFWILKTLQDKVIRQSCIQVCRLVSLFPSWQFAAFLSQLLFSFNPRVCTLSATGCIRPARWKFFDSDSFATFAWGSVWRVSLVVLSKPPYLRWAYCRARRPGLGRSFAPSGSVLQQEGNSTNLQIFSRLIPILRPTLSLTYLA